MQPHSIAATALANYFWNYPEHIQDADTTMYIKIGYTNEKGSRNLYYKAENIEVTPEKIVASYSHQSGGAHCRIEMTRNSTSDKFNIEYDHSVQHASGFAEEIEMSYKSTIRGDHRNSKRYGKVSGTLRDSKRITLFSEVKFFNTEHHKFIEYDVVVS